MRLVPEQPEFYGRVATNVTTTLNTAQDVTGLSFQVGENQVWGFEADLSTACDNVDGIKFAANAPNGSTIEARIKGMSAATTSILFDRLTAIATLTTGQWNTAAIDGWVNITATLSVGSTAGTVQIQFASNTAGQASTIYAGSTLRAWRIA